MKQSVKIFDKLFLKELDTNIFQAQLLINDEPYNVEGMVVNLVVSSRDKILLNKQVEIIDATNGMVEFQVNEAIGNGVFQAELVATVKEYPDYKLIFPNHDYLSIHIVPSLLENKVRFYTQNEYNQAGEKYVAEIETKLEEINGEDYGNVTEDLTRTSDIKLFLRHALHAKGLDIDETTPFREYPDKVTSMKTPLDMAKMLIERNTTDTFEIPNGVTKISRSAFANTNFTKIIIPASVTTIGSMVFNDSSVTEINIPTTVKTIESMAFYNCKKLKTIIIPDTCTISSTYSLFSGCGSLEEVTLGKGITSLNSSIFEGCSKLKKVSVSSNIIYIYSAFENCTSLIEIHIDLPSTQTQLTVPADKWGATNATIYWNDGKTTK